MKSSSQDCLSSTASAPIFSRRWQGPKPPASGVPEGLADDAPVRFAVVAVGLAAYPAVDTCPEHQIEHGLVDDSLAQLGAQAHDKLPTAAVVGGGREDFHERPVRSSTPAGLIGAPACTPARRLGEGLSACPKIGPERLGTALAAEFTSPLERLHGHDPERLHGVLPVHATVIRIWPASRPGTAAPHHRTSGK